LCCIDAPLGCNWRRVCCSGYATRARSDNDGVALSQCATSVWWAFLSRCRTRRGAGWCERGAWSVGQLLFGRPRRFAFGMHSSCRRAHGHTRPLVPRLPHHPLNSRHPAQRSFVTHKLCFRLFSLITRPAHSEFRRRRDVEACGSPRIAPLCHQHVIYHKCAIYILLLSFDAHRLANVKSVKQWMNYGHSRPQRQ
jgi:hypothetical protein